MPGHKMKGTVLYVDHYSLNLFLNYTFKTYSSLSFIFYKTFKNNCLRTQLGNEQKRGYDNNDEHDGKEESV